MGRGIKKISENVIANKRSLTLVTSSEGPVYSTQMIDTVIPFDIADTEAMPLGMLNVDYGIRGLSMKISQGQWSKLDARNTLINETVTTNILGNSAVTTEKIKDQNVTTAKIKDQNITTEKLRDSAVTTPKIADSNVTTSKIADGNVTNSKLDKDSVTTIKIKDQAVTAPKIGDGAVLTQKIYDKAVTTAKIANNAVTCQQIAASAPVNGEADKRIATENLQDGVITTSKIADRAVTSAKIAQAGVSTGNLQNSCVTTEKIADGAVTTDKLANQAVTGDKIAQNTITKDKLDPTVIDSLDRAVLHDGNRNVTGEGESTLINNLTVTGDIRANRVFNIIYMDIAEGYEPGEALEPGDIVAIHEDGKVYKAKTINECIVGVVSDEYANCLGASKEELFSGSKVAVGMIGKIHVKVKGPVRLGQRISISTSDEGVGIANWMNINNIGQALETINCDFDEIHKVLIQVRPM